MTEKSCKNCGKKFQAQRSTAEFCGDVCRVDWNRNRVTVDAGKAPPELEKMSVQRLGPVAPEPAKAVIASVPSVPIAANRKPWPRIWPVDTKEADVRERLYRMRDYRAWADREGMPEKGVSRQFVLDRLAEVGADRKLVKIVFP